MMPSAVLRIRTRIAYRAVTCNHYALIYGWVNRLFRRVVESGPPVHMGLTFANQSPRFVVGRTAELPAPAHIGLHCQMPSCCGCSRCVADCRMSALHFGQSCPGGPFLQLI